MALADFLITLLTFVAVYSLFGLGLNVKYGFTGLVDFGHVAYFMIGGYVTVVLTMPADVSGYAGIGGFDLPALFGALFPGGGLVGWFVGIVGGMIAAAVVSLLVGVPTLRLREDYLAITALGIATILNAVFENEEWLFNGPFGVQSVYQPLGGVFPVGFGSFTLNMVVLGGLSVLLFLAAGYSLVQYARDAGTRTRALIGVMTAVFVLWYFVQPFLTGGGMVELQKNVMWLFDPNAGPNGGLDYDRFFLLFATALVVVAYWWVERTVNSPYGRVLRAIRDDEDVPKALGKETYRYKIQAMMLGSGLAGAAGALYSIQLGFISPEQFGATLTFFAFTAVIIGGTANNKGVILGTTAFWVINSGTRFLNDYIPSEFSVQLAATRLMLIGALLIVILYFRPEGLLGEQDYNVNVPEEADANASTRGLMGGEGDD
ncbi:MAG: neutral amino acid transport system permease protein [Natronomonas sp.]|jgi:neutral amino acid transport system permease protein